MATVTDPVIDQWYKDVENDLTFKVVAYDEGDDSIDVQYHNGDIGEFDNDSWYNSTFDFIEAPEDWNAPFDDLEPDDLGYSNSDTRRSDMDDAPLQEFLD